MAGLVTTQQFPGLVPDVGRALQGGLQFAQGLQGMQAQRQAMQRQQQQSDIQEFEFQDAREKARAQSVFKGALEIQPMLSQGDTVGALKTLSRRKEALDTAGIDSSDTQEMIDIIDKGNIDEALSLSNQMIEFGQRMGFDPMVVSPAQSAKLAIDLQKLDLRKEEAELRSLEMQEKKETNQLRREELRQKIDEKESQIESAQKEKEFQAESSFATIDNSLKTIDELLKGDRVTKATGVEAALPTLPGTEKASVEAFLEQLQSQNFLNEIEKMKGLGALSEAEGRKVSAALSAIDPKMKDEDILKELKELKGILDNSKKRLIKKTGVEPKPEGGNDLTDEELRELEELRARFPSGNP